MIIPSQFIITTKRTGQIKCRWVACDFRTATTLPENYSPTLHSHSLQTLMQLYINNPQYTMQTADVKSAFLHGRARTHTVIRAPAPLNDVLYKVTGNLYGLQSAAATWRKLLNRILCDIGMRPSLYDSCLYSYHEHLYLGVHVDDILFVGEPQQISKILFRLKHCFTLSTPNSSKLDFLGLVFDLKDKSTLEVHQTDFLKKKFEEFGFHHSKPAPLPRSAFKPVEQRTELLPDARPYQQLLGCLNYLRHTRADIIFAATALSHHNVSPRLQDKDNLNYVWSYLYGTMDLRVTYPRAKLQSIHIKTHLDASWHHNEEISFTSGLSSV